MADTKMPKQFARMTPDGRVIVNVNSLYRSRQVQEALRRLDQKIGRINQQSDLGDTQTAIK